MTGKQSKLDSIVSLDRMLGRDQALPLAAWAAYGLAFVPLYGAVGPAAVTLGVVPVLVTAWRLGALGGLAAGVLAFPVAVLLLVIAGGATAPLLTPSGLIGSGVLALSGALGGMVHGLHAGPRRGRSQRGEAQETVKRQNTQLDAVSAVSNTLSSPGKLEEILQNALSVTVDMLGMTAGLVALCDSQSGELTLAAQRGLPQTLLEQLRETGVGLLWHGQPLGDDDGVTVQSLEGHRPQVSLLLETGFQYVYRTPIIHGAAPLGLLLLLNSQPVGDDDPTAAILRAIGQQLGLAVAKAQLLREATRERRVARSLRETGGVFSANLGFGQLFERIFDQLHDLIPYDAAFVCLIDEERCEVTATRGLDGPSVGQTTLLADYPQVERIVRERRPLILTGSQEMSLLTAPGKRRGIDSWLGVPLTAQGKTIGLVIVGFQDQVNYSEDTRRVVTAFANDAGLAIENSRMYRQMRSQVRYVTIVHDVTAAISSTLAIDRVLPVVARSLCVILPATQVEVFGLDDDGRIATALASYTCTGAGSLEEGLEPGYQESVEALPGTSEALERNQPLQMRAEDRGLAPEVRRILGEKNASTLLVLPMVTPNSALGFARVWATGSARRFTRRDIATAQSLAHQTAFAMENARLFEKTRASLTETQALYRASRSLIARRNLDEVLQAVVDETVEALGADRAAVMTFDLEQGCVDDFVKGGPGADEVVEVPFEELWSGLSGWVLRELKPALSRKAGPDSREGKHVQRRREETNCGSIVVAPLIYQGAPLGTMTAINRPDQRDFTEGDVGLLMAFANHAAAALQNARLMEETQRRASQLAAAADVGRHATAITDSKQLLEVVVELIRERFDYRLTAVFLIDGTKKELYPAAATAEFQKLIPNGYRQPLGLGAMGKTAQSGETLLIADARKGSADGPIGEGICRSSLSVPVQIGGTVLGVLQVEADRAGTFDENDQLALEIIADQMAIGYHNAELLAEMRSRMRDLQMLHDVSLAAASSSHLQDTLQAAAAALAAEWKETQVALQLVDRPRDVLRMKASVGYPVESDSDLDLPLGVGITGWVAEHGEAVLVPDVREDSRYYAANPATRSELCVPLTAGGVVIGTLNLESPEVDAFSLHDERLLTTLASNLAMLIERAHLFEEIEAAHAQLEQRAEALETANVRLKEVDRLKSEFLATMSHELRTPLTSVIGFSEVLLEGMLGDMPAEQRDCVRSIYNSGEHILALINDVLDLSKIEAGRMELAPESLSVGELIANVQKTCQPMFKEKSQTLIIDLAEHLPPLTADPVRLRQVLLNLLSNAHKFTPEEGRITLSCDLADDATMVFSVADTGIGIKPEDEAIIFEEFRQATHPAGRRVEGTGLGLTITRRLVEMHHGSIWVESQYGEGAAFSFLLPLDGPTSTPTREVKEDTLPEGPSALLVDDDRAFSNLLAVYLRKGGHEPMQIYDESSVVEVARASNPTVIVLKLALAQRDGWELLRRLKSARATVDIPIVLVAAREDGQKAQLLGPVEYVFAGDSLHRLASALSKAGPSTLAGPSFLVGETADLGSRLQETLPTDAYTLVPLSGDGYDNGAQAKAGRPAYIVRTRNGRPQHETLSTREGQWIEPQALAREIQRIQPVAQ